MARKRAAGKSKTNGSMSSNQSGEGDIRRALIEADLVECMVALPGQLFYSTQIPVCLWFLSRKKPMHRARETLFLDARKLGTMIDRVHRELTDDDVARLSDTYHAWRADRGTGILPVKQEGKKHGQDGRATRSLPENQEKDVRGTGILPVKEDGGKHGQDGRGTGILPVNEETQKHGQDGRATYRDIPGFCRSATIDEIARHGHVLTPGRYVGAEEVEDDGEPFAEKMQRLVAALNEQFAESRKLEKAIRANLEGLGYGS